MLTDIPPPPCAVTMGSDDPDEVTSWVSRQSGGHSRVVHGNGPYGFSMARLPMTRLQMAWARARLAHTLRGCFPKTTFHLPMRAGQRYSYGRRLLEVDARAWVFIPSGAEVTRYGEGDPMLAIEVDDSSLTDEMRQRQADEQVEWPRVPQALTLTPVQRQQLLEAIAVVLHSHQPGAPASVSVHCESQLLSALADSVPQSMVGQIASLSASRLDRVEDWIEAHIADVITLGRLCEVAQVGARALQLAFERRHGVSPMRFVFERRLSAVQRRLARAEAGDDVTTVATRLGFTHLGRFSIAYRAAFAESPSQTLQRGARARRLGC